VAGAVAVGIYFACTSVLFANSFSPSTVSREIGTVGDMQNAKTCIFCFPALSVVALPCFSFRKAGVSNGRR
jgi:hypothetical protein